MKAIEKHWVKRALEYLSRCEALDSEHAAKLMDIVVAITEVVEAVEEPLDGSAEEISPKPTSKKRARKAQD